MRRGPAVKRPECYLKLIDGVAKCEYCGRLYEGKNKRLEFIHRPCQSDDPRPKRFPDDGPGTRLHNLIAAAGYEVSKNCKCRTMIRRMNYHGAQWCRDHEDEIVSVMVAEAEKRKLPYPKAALRWKARKWIRKAVREWEASRVS